MFVDRFAADKFAANNRIANRFAAVLTTKTFEVSPLESKIGPTILFVCHQLIAQISSYDFVKRHFK